MRREYVFVSCDIVSHSAEPNLEKQRENVVAINEIVRKALDATAMEGAVWASGGDGGHVAFPVEARTQALELIVQLREWSRESGVRLRVVGNCGPADVFGGADGRKQLVGPGINLAGKLLPFGDQGRVIVTADFIKCVGAAFSKAISVHDERRLQLRNLPDETVLLLSAEGTFHSTWDTPIHISDRVLLQAAWEAGRPLEVIYRAKRLFEVNAEDSSAKNTLRMLALKGTRPQGGRSFIYDLLFDEEFGLDFLNASSLVERKNGEVVCYYGDHGTTMFLILKGHLGVFFPKQPEVSSPSPDSTMGPGELAGELAFALGRPRTATLRCLEDSAFLAFSSSELFSKLHRAKTGPQLTRAVERKLLSRIIENVWNSANCFRGRDAPEALAELSAPWVTLLSHTNIVAIARNGRSPDFSSAMRDLEGLCILVSGRVRNDDDDTILDGANYPILHVHFTDELVYEGARYRALDDVKLVTIAKDGLLELGFESYAEVLKRTRLEVVKGKAEGGTVQERRYDVFLSHNSKDKAAVRTLKDQLGTYGISVWLDEEELRPGIPWQQLLEAGIRHSACVAVLVGRDGVAPWEDEEMQAALRLAVRDKRPVIPVLLPGTPTLPDLPMFLGNRTWVDLREGFDRRSTSKLVWGITGKKPSDA